MSSCKVSYGPSATNIPTLNIIYEDYYVETLQNCEAKLVNGMLRFADRWHVGDSHINADGSLAVNIIFDGDEEC